MDHVARETDVLSTDLLSRARLGWGSGYRNLTAGVVTGMPALSRSYAPCQTRLRLRVFLGGHVITVALLALRGFDGGVVTLIAVLLRGVTIGPAVQRILGIMPQIPIILGCDGDVSGHVTTCLSAHHP